MATKPTDTVPDWPSNAVYVAGPSAGLATTVDPTPFAGDGHIEGVTNPTGAQVQNGWQKRAGNWCRWVEDGSFAGAADAHIVETDDDGATTVRKLQVLGNPGVGGLSLSVTRGAAATEAAGFITTGVSNVLVGGDGYAMQMTSNVGGVAVGVTGNNIPLTLFPQATRPTTFVGNDGGLYFETVPITGDDGVALRAITNGKRMSVPLYRDQHVHAFEYDGGSDTTYIGGSGTDTSILQLPMIFYTGVAPLDANIPMIYEITTSVQVVGFVATTVTFKFKNNGGLIRSFPIEINNLSGFQDVSLRGIYATGALALDGNSFDATIVGGANNIVCRHSVVTIRGAR